VKKAKKDKTVIVRHHVKFDNISTKKLYINFDPISMENIKNNPSVYAKNIFFFFIIYALVK